MIPDIHAASFNLYKKYFLGFALSVGFILRELSACYREWLSTGCVIQEWGQVTQSLGEGEGTETNHNELFD